MKDAWMKEQAQKSLAEPLPSRSYRDAVKVLSISDNKEGPLPTSVPRKLWHLTHERIDTIFEYF